ncbi:MAG: hypothetical protein GF333_07020 [Candidatus Omnitrophica bacterium]|nr:hypothetical protein [Candidatus Omnitrophota bacterium]
MHHSQYDVVFEGGGVKSVALIGALERFAREGVEFDRVAGTSAGAITAAMLAAGYTAAEMKEILWQTDFNEFANVSIFRKRKWRVVFSRHIFDLFSLFLGSTGYGVFSTDDFYEWVKDILVRKGVTDFLSAPRYLRVFAVDLFRQRLLRFDRDVTPHLEIAEAVRLSMSIPLFFKAKVSEDELIVDGGILANYPIDTFVGKGNITSTLGFKLTSEEQTLPLSTPANIFAYLMRIFETMQVAKERLHVKQAHWARTIPIPTGSISTIKFDLTEEDKQFLWESGYEAAQEAIRKGVLSEGGRR